ncbi:MAG: flavin reductase (DIM6/NTAB) family NADH-FMN oxidoreductase RutF [Halieaceae bacterium]|jgi:flavin reductase (DIM6/NTAB) family NADH-FMN oxidoreductase RutF
MHLNHTDIAALDRRRRALLINSVTGFKPAVLVGSVDGRGQSNLAIMSSLVHLGSHPPLLALVLRPDSAERHTLGNIRATGVYTINHVHADIIEAAHQTAARYPREISEFAATGLTEHWLQGFAAPFVAEARVRMAIALREEHYLAINGTHLLIGEIRQLEVPQEALREDGALDPALADTVAIAGLDSYYRGRHERRMAYAKPDTPPQTLE